MKGLNLSKFYKVKEDAHSAELVHKDGHRIIISKGSLPHMHRKQLESLPLQKMAKGGKVQHYDYGSGGVEPTPQANADTPTPGAQATWQDPQQNQSIQPGGYQPASPDVPNSTQQNGSVTGTTEGAQPVQPDTANEASVLASKGDAFTAQQNANTELANAQGTEGRQKAMGISLAQNAADLLPTANDVIQNHQVADDNAMHAYMDQKIDPKKYWQDHSKTAAVIGSIISGLGQAMGGHGPNQAIASINAGIDREIQLQKNNQDKAYNLWKMNREATGNDLAANLQTRNQLYTNLQYQLQKTAAQNAGPIALAQAHAMNAQIQQQKQLNYAKMAWLGNTREDTDPAVKLGQGVQLGMIPQTDVPKVAEEVKNNQDLVSLSPKIKDAFFKAADEVRPLTGGFNTSLTSIVPGMESPAQKQFEGLINTTVKETEGTARAAAFKSIQDTMKPQFGDDEDTIETKWNTVQNYLASHASAPVAKANHIDLNKYPQTRFIMTPQRGDKPKTIIQQGHTYKWNMKNGGYE